MQLKMPAYPMYGCQNSALWVLWLLRGSAACIPDVGGLCACRIARHATQMWALPGLVVVREQNTSSSTDSTQLSLPSGSAVAEWASFSPVGRTAGVHRLQMPRCIPPRGWIHRIELIYQVYLTL